VVGVAGNYIIHSFGGGGGGPIPPVSNTLPTEYWEFHGEVPPITGPSFGYQAMPSAASDLYNGVGAPLGPTTVIPGMAGFLTADVAIPTQPFRGFLCNESGMYLVDPQMEARMLYTAIDGVGTNLGPYYANFTEFNADGSFNKHASAPAFVPFESNTNPTPPPPPSAVGISGLFFKQSAPNLGLTHVLNPFPLDDPNFTYLSQNAAHFGAGGAITDNSKLLSIVPNVAIPAGSLRGFRVDHDPGMWGITWNARFDINSTTISDHIGCSVVVLAANGTTVKYINHSPHVSPGGRVATIIDCPDADEVKLPLEIGDYVFMAPRFNGTDPAGAGLNRYQWSYATFLYYGVYPVAPPPLPLLAPLAPASTTIDWRYNTSFLQPLEAGKFYVPSFSWDDSSGGIIGESTIIGGIAFVYWAPFVIPPPGPPLLRMQVDSESSSSAPLSTSSSLVSAKSDLSAGYITFGSKEDQWPSRKSASIQMANAVKEAMAERGRQLSLGTSSSFSSGSSSSAAPHVSLSDLEKIVGNMMKQQQEAQQVAAASRAITIVGGPPSRKRSRKDSGEKEPM